MKMHRRQALALLGLGVAAPGLGHAASTSGGAFQHGVASGDPLQDRVVIWTRLSSDTPMPNSTVTWEVAHTPAFARIARRGQAPVTAARDHTVKVDVAGLQPGREYFYRFRTRGEVSPMGRTRTLPRGRTADVVLAVASCALHPGGLFNVYDAIARLPRVDAVVHLGDYIYEYGAAEGDYGMSVGRALGRVPEPPREIVSLADYRLRHAQYKSDPDLQAAHARAPWIVVWDDHETANDAWLNGAENHNPGRGEGDWRARKAAALQAYYEWMPIREPRAGAGFEAVNRSFQFGDLASLIMVETRLLGRAEQLSYEGAPQTAEGRPDIAAVLEQVAHPARRLLGERQERWLAGELTASVRAGRAWQILGNQVVMARVNGPDFDAALGTEGTAAVLSGVSERVRARVAAMAALFRAPAPFNLDAWDGYPAARERLYASVRAAGARPIVLAGDSHAFWVNDLRDASGGCVGAEFGASAVTSPSWGDALPGVDLGGIIAAQNREVLFADQSAKGFVLLTLGREAALGELIAVSTVRAKPYDTRVLKRYRVTAAARGVGEIVEA